ncbi:MAG: RHS repeat-associated core domain-containing protein [Acidobacteriaceae bacterium]
MTGNRRFHPLAVVAVIVCVGAVAPVASGARPKAQNVGGAAAASTVPGARDGQSRTLLPNGRILLLGGEASNGRVTTALLQDRETEAFSKIATGLLHARSYHSASLLPNGKVFIFGGIGESGSVISQAELFDPATDTFTNVSTSGLTPRAHHTATLLTDGRLLIAGGTDAGGNVLGELQIWDYRTGQATTLAVNLKTPRTGHTAALLADGTVLLSGGRDSNGSALDYGEIVDPNGPTTRFSGQSPVSSDDSEPPSLEASIPQSGETGVEVDQVISFRFSTPMDVTTLSVTTITLAASGQNVPIDVVPAENGMLAFVTPQSPLQAGTTYVVSISGATDPSGHPLPNTSVLFTTAFPDDGTGTTGSASSGNGWAGNGAIPANSSGLNSRWRKLPMLPGPAGVTSLAGQVLTLDGKPLSNVLVQIDSRTATTDGTGRFVVQDVGVGHHIMLVDGGPAGSKGATYGIYRVGVNLKAGQTNSLNYTVWMPALDTQHVVRISSPTTSDMVITNPNVPGVELHLPAGTVIHDARGKLVTQIGITPIPNNQAPFPLKRGVTFPIYFTIQPGGASFTTPGNTLSPRGPRPRGAQIYYQNRYNAKPGTTFTFWNYDPSQKGWFVYGLGHVSADGKMIVPDPNTQIWSFDGAMVALPPDGPPFGPLPGNPHGGEPVDLQTGLFLYTKTDLVLHDVIPLVLTIHYRQSDYTSRAFGIGANMDYDMFLVGDAEDTPEGYTYQKLIFGDGSDVYFTRTSPCLGANGYCDYTNAVYTATSTPGPFYGAILQWTGGMWVITTKAGLVLQFPDSTDSTIWQQAAIIGMHDRYGNSLTFTRDGNSNLTEITSPNGRWIQFTYDSSNRVIQAQDNLGRQTSYTYNADGYLATATDANRGVTSYTYDGGGNMLSITDPRGITYIQNVYDDNDMVTQQTLANGGVYQFIYEGAMAGVGGNGSNIVQTNVIDPLGNERIVTFDSDGYMTSDTRAVGKPEVQAVTYQRQEGTGLLLSMTDALNRTTNFSYDSMADVTGITQLAGSSNPVTTTLSYTSQYYELASVTDPLGNTTSLGYDNNGNMTSITDPTGNTAQLGYNSAGQPTSVTDPMGNETQLTYQSGNLVSISDPLGRTASAFVDAAGRVAAITDPLSHLTRIGYDPLDRITSVVDPLGNQTSFTYDGNSDLLTVTDANQHTTTFTYNNMDLVATRQDPLKNTASYQYDLNDNLTQLTDRKGQVTTVNYDGLNRPTFVGYGTQAGPTYQSTVGYTWDAGNRLTGVSDSIAGSISRSYDGLNGLLSETTTLGSVAYTYDADERRQTMTVSGQTEVNYTWDNDSRLTAITQGATDVAFTYDGDWRRTSMQLPNAVLAAYSYDAASELTGIVYQGGALAPSNLAYSYDLDGHRTGVSGSLASTQLPAAVSSAVYNADNQLTQWGSTTMTYDADGNTLNDGTNTYTWDARNDLVSADNNGASFVYDGLGRRFGKTMLGANTNFLYDGLNPVQELNGTTATANLLTGGLDERFTRTDATGTFSYLTDALGSTTALTNSTGASQVQYSYDPYGSMSITGTSTNSYAYTGREFDGLGIDYYRARYYNPQTGRFISEDPIGLAAGTNEYAYAGNDPIDFIDPLGMDRGPGGSGPGTAPNNGCSSALSAANRSPAGVARANAAWSVLQTASNANGIPTALLAAIGVRETNFMNVQEYGGGPGMGVFQLTNQPGVSAAQAFNLSFSANYAAGMLSSNMNYLSGAFSFTPSQLLQATAASYNFDVGNISGNPNTIDVGTTGGNYGSTVVGIMSCFSHP